MYDHVIYLITDNTDMLTDNFIQYETCINVRKAVFAVISIALCPVTQSLAEICLISINSGGVFMYCKSAA